VALADTAKLVASLELQDKFSKPLGNANTALGNFERKAGTIGRVGEQVGRGLQSTATNLSRIGIIGAGLLTAAVTNGVHQLELLENASAQTNAVLESTGGVAGQTAESIRNLAEKYEGLNATIDDKVIQSGENLLLTFTNIGEKAFEPALVAALNLNTALGGGEEGLQNTIIQVGKALQDPIRGLTNLRRVGVNFTEQQKAQIKQLVAANDLYGAQQIILQELGTEFGGSFAAAGDTAAGKFAKVRDAVEDAQAALATAFLPVLEKVADKLGTFLSDPATVQRIEDFGGQLAAGFDKALDVIGQIDFGAIGASLEIAGTGAKAVFDAFVNLPPWVQTAVLTGWGLNKLTGGALGGIAGTLGKALFQGTFGMRGATPANPLFVASVNGGLGGAPVAGVPAAAGVGSVIKSLLGVTTAVGLGAILGNAIGREVFFNPTVAPAKEFEQQQLTNALDSGDVERLQSGLATIDESLQNLKVDILPGGLGQLLFGQEIDELTTQRQIILDQLAAIEAAEADRKADVRTLGEKAVRQIDAINGLHLPLGIGNALISQIRDKATTANDKAAQQLDALRGSAGSLIRLEEKKFDPTVNVNVAATANISVSNVTRTLTSFRIAGSTTVGGFTESAF
jgi:hypothetical protein